MSHLRFLQGKCQNATRTCNRFVPKASQCIKIKETRKLNRQECKLELQGESRGRYDSSRGSNGRLALPSLGMIAGESLFHPIVIPAVCAGLIIFRVGVLGILPEVGDIVGGVAAPKDSIYS